MDRRPSLVLSPRRLRPRRAIPPRYPCNPPAKKSPDPIKGTNSKKAQQALRSSVSGASLFRPESDSISSELLSIAKNSKNSETLNLPKTLNLSQTLDDKENQFARNSTSNCSPVKFERGRLYDLYSAKRNERLKRRQMELMEETEVIKISQNPAIAVELQRKKVTKRSEISRNSIAGEMSVSKIPMLRSSVRNSREMKNLGFEENFGVKGTGTTGTGGCMSTRRIGTRSAVKRY